MNENKHATTSTWIDPDEAPELTDAFFERADLYQGDKRVRRGRPKAAHTKEPVKLRLDADVLAALRDTGDGWQTRINDMLRASLHLAGKV